MKILLIKPSWPYPYSKGDYTYNRIWPPLSLANCAALLEKEGHKVKILDAHARRIVPEKIAGFIKGYDKVFITSSSLDKWQCPNIDINPFLETARYAKRVSEEVYIIGYHGTAEPQKILRLTRAKAVIRGEPEYTVAEICRNEDLFKIEGISFVNNGNFISTPQGPPIDLKALPMPAYHLLDINSYFYEILGKNFALFEISRGCRFMCKFCNKVMYGKGLRLKSREQIFKEVTQAIEKYNVRTAYFIDLDFLSDREMAEGLCDYLIKKKYRFKWACQTRPDLLDAEIIKKMKAAGCKIIHMGVETGIQELLNYVNKNITVEKIEKAVQLCREAGMETLAFFLLGLPGETSADREEMLKFAKNLNPNFASFHRATPYKGSDLYQDNIGRDESVDKFIRKALVEFYLRPSYLRKLNLSAGLYGFRLFCGRIGSLR